MGRMTGIRNIVILTGAGVSAESGLRTFRASDGLWEDHRIEDVASPEGFRRDPDARPVGKVGSETNFCPAQCRK